MMEKVARDIVNDPNVSDVQKVVPDEEMARPKKVGENSDDLRAEMYVIYQLIMTNKKILHPEFECFLNKCADIVGSRQTSIFAFVRRVEVTLDRIYNRGEPTEFVDKDAIRSFTPPSAQENRKPL